MAIDKMANNSSEAYSGITADVLAVLNNRI